MSEKLMIVSVSYAMRVIQKAGRQMHESYQSQFRDFEQKSSKTLRDKYVSLQNVETNEVAERILKSGSLKGFSIAALYGAFRRLHNALEILENYPGDHVFPLMNDDDDTFFDVLEFFLMGLDMTSDKGIQLLVTPKDQMPIRDNVYLKDS